MKVAIVIPARFASSRLPGKPLLRDSGKYLIQHVYERCLQAQRVDDVFVATDDARIAEAVSSFGAPFQMTSSEHPSGTDRVAEVARRIPHDVVINVQGDEPQMDPEDIDALVEALEKHPDDPIATLATPIPDRSTFLDPNVCKVVVDGEGCALYFSRSPIPHCSDPPHPDSAAWTTEGVPQCARKHHGVYAFRREALLELAALPPVAIERLERLEQLRALSYGLRIRLVPGRSDGIEVNTPEDYRRFLGAIS